MVKQRGSLTISHKSYFNIFPYNIVVVYKKGGDFQEMINEAKRGYPDLSGMDGDPLPPTVDAFVYSNEKGTGNIYFFMTDSMTLDILVHECVHIVSRIFDTLDSDLNESTEEFYAYLMEYTFRDLYKLITEKFNLNILSLSR